MKIAKRAVGESHNPLIIAELSGNHNGSLKNALEMVKAAADSGVEAIKLQTYTADTLTIDHRGGLFDISDKDSLWFGKSLYELYKEAHTPWEWHKEIFEYAESLGLIAFSSPFDETAVDYLEELKVPAYKIASFESNHHPLLKKVAKTGKPILISSGASRLDDLYESVKVLREEGAKEICVLKCTSAYPASASSANLRTIPVFKEIFRDCEVGLSDHTLGIGVALASLVLGASIIEKHFTLRRGDGGVDSAFSMEPDEMKSLVIESRRIWESLGTVQLDTQKTEEKSKQFRRSIYVVEPIKKGQRFSEQNIRVIRPGDGRAPKYYEQLLGSVSDRDYEVGTPFPKIEL